MFQWWTYYRLSLILSWWMRFVVNFLKNFHFLKQNVVSKFLRPNFVWKMILCVLLPFLMVQIQDKIPAPIDDIGDRLTYWRKVLIIASSIIATDCFILYNRLTRSWSCKMWILLTRTWAIAIVLIFEDFNTLKTLLVLNLIQYKRVLVFFYRC